MRSTPPWAGLERGDVGAAVVGLERQCGNGCPDSPRGVPGLPHTTVNGFLASTGLDLTPFCNPHH